MRTRRHHGSHRSTLPRAVATAGICLTIATGSSGLAGCQRSLFQEKDPRTQFETYDRMRERYVPTETYDVFGNPRPALRERLRR